MNYVHDRTCSLAGHYTDRQKGGEVERRRRDMGERGEREEREDRGERRERREGRNRE